MTSTRDLLDRFRTAVEANDLAGVLDLLSPDVRLNSPILEDPIVGLERVRPVLQLIVDQVPDLAYGQTVLTGDGTHALTLSATVGEHRLDGVELFSIDEQGRISEVTVALRPLAALVALQNVLAPAIGQQPLKLTA